MRVDCIVRGGKVVIPKQGIFEVDIAIGGEKIIQIGKEIPDGGKIIDAKGKYVFPGCIDIHTHYGHWNEFYSEMESESKGLAHLGVTTSVILLDRCIKNMEEWKERIDDPKFFVRQPGMLHYMWKASYKNIFPEVIEKSEKFSSNDFAFHLLMTNRDQMDEMSYYYGELGIASFKCWTGLEGAAALAIPEMWLFLKKCKETGALPYVNTINAGLQEQITQEVGERAKADKTFQGLILKKESAPGIVETVDLHTTLCLAKEVGVPELLVAHVSFRDSVKLIRYYRREHGLNVQGEVCGTWLSLWWPEVGENLGYRVTRIIPQIGYKEDTDMLWDGIRTGDITCIGTDGAVSPSENYPDGKANPWFLPPATREREGRGFPGHTCLFPVVLHLGMERGFSPVDIAEVCAYNPAKLMRLYPKKGTIAVGSDADFVIAEIGKPHTVRRAEIKTNAPYCPWEGWELNCWPVLTMIRGQVVFQDGSPVKEKCGKYQPRYPTGREKAL